MQFGSPHPSLFDKACANPTEYAGPPNPRRAKTPSTVARRTDTGKVKKLRNAVAVKDGMCLSPSALNSPSSEGELLTLENFDEQMRFSPGMVIINSPRSIAACRRLGVIPTELLCRTPEEVVEEMKAKGEPTSDEAVVQMRYNYVCRRRDQKLRALRQEREKLIVEGIASVSGYLSPSSVQSASPENKRLQTATTVAKEERRLQKIIEANTAKLRQQLLHEELNQKHLEKEDENRRQRQRLEEQRRDEERQWEMAKCAKEEEAQRLRNEARDLERQRKALLVAEKRREYEAKDEERRDKMLHRQMMVEAQNEVKRQHNTQRRMQMHAQAEQHAKERRKDFEERWEQFEQSQRDFAEQRAQHNIERRLAAERKQEKIEEAKKRCDSLIEAKVAKTEDKEMRAMRQLKERETERELELQRKMEDDVRKERQRKAAYEAARQRNHDKVCRITNKITRSEKKMKEMGEERAAQSRVRQEVQKERQLDKHDCVERTKRADEAARDALMAKIDEKSQRVDHMRFQQDQLKLKRKTMRQEAERTRVKIQTAAPGPADYMVTKDSVGTSGPRWKFGLPASVLAARQISRTVPAEGYESSPGPCVYAPQLRAATPAPVLCSHDRWQESPERHATPGPLDYRPNPNSISKR